MNRGWSAVSKARKRFAGDRVPESAFLLAEYMKRYGIESRKTAEGQLRRMADSGELQTGMKRVKTPAGWRMMRVYWIP